MQNITFHRTYQDSSVFSPIHSQKLNIKNATVGLDLEENIDKFKIEAADQTAVYTGRVYTVAKCVWMIVHNASWYRGNTAP